MKISCLQGAMCAGIFSLASFSSHASLIDNGGGLIYDSVLDITWSQPDARRSWNAATTWAAGLTLGGVSGWRLPYTSVAAGAGPTGYNFPVSCSTSTEAECRDNEMGYMFFYDLGGISGSPILYSGDPNLDLFPSLLSYTYWSGTAIDSLGAWNYYFSGGAVSFDYKFSGDPYSWAVHDGNIGAVPLPAAMWVFGSGLLVLVGLARRKKAS